MSAALSRLSRAAQSISFAAERRRFGGASPSFAEEAIGIVESGPSAAGKNWYQELLDGQDVRCYLNSNSSVAGSQRLHEICGACIHGHSAEKGGGGRAADRHM